MSAEVNPIATKHLPIFITPPGATDVLMVVTTVFLVCAIMAVGLIFLRLHSLPRHIANRGQKLQANIIAVLCLIALFTQIWGFWIAALLLALVEFPDFEDWTGRIASAVERIAGIKSPPISSEPPSRSELGRSRGGRDVPVPPAVDLPAHLGSRRAVHAGGGRPSRIATSDQGDRIAGRFAASRNACYWHEADIAIVLNDVRFRE